MEGSHICDFYSAQSVFLTGASGFLGKAILEKLLRACPDLRNIYVLLRPSKSKGDVQQRLEKILHSPIFDRIKQNCPESLSKVLAICGDIDLPNLGINEFDRNLILNNVSIVIHTAATIKFTEPLNVAFNTNYYGTERVLDLVKSLKNLRAFVHVSTAYANCDLDEIREEILTPDLVIFNPKNLPTMSDKLIEEITPRVLGNKPNTYTCSKAYTEYLLKVQGAGLPICIVRPSIIVCCWKEPEPGFVDTLTGTTGILAAGLKRLLNCLHSDGEFVHDMIPLDIVVNLIIASAWDIATQRPSDIPVYNCCTGPTNPVKFNEMSYYLMSAALKVGVRQHTISRQLMWVVKSKSLHRFINFFLSYLPCFLLDLGSSAVGKKPVMLNYLSKVETALDSLSFFVSKEFKFAGNNMQILDKKMTPTDQQLFYLDLKKLDWPQYFVHYTLGIYKWIFKEPVKTSTEEGDLEIFSNRFSFPPNWGRLMSVSLCILVPAVTALICHHSNNIFT